MKPFLLFGFCCAVLLAPGCSIQKMALRSIDGIFDGAMEAIMEEEDLTLAEQSIGGDLKLIDGLLKSDPENQKLLLLACQGYTSYSLAFAEDSLDRARMFYMRAQNYGMRALILKGLPDSVFRADPSTMRQALTSLSKDDLPLVFWTANAWGSAVNLQRDNPEAVASLPTVNAMMQWVRGQDSAYYYGGPLLYFGTFYGSLPAMFGGDTARSRVCFNRAIAAAGGKFLMTYVFFAKSYAVQTQDEPLFRQLLAHVIEAPLDILPEQRLANSVAKIHARQLLARVGELF